MVGGKLRTQVTAGMGSYLVNACDMDCMGFSSSYYSGAMQAKWAHEKYLGLYQATKVSNMDKR